MNAKAFIRGFLDELEKLGMSIGVGAGPTAAMTPPPVGGLVKQRRPKPMGATTSMAGSPTPLQNPVATPVG
jgi:ribose 5-phosphate isomerase